MSEGNDVPKVTMAEKFMVLDEYGNKRALFGIRQGEPCFVFFGRDGTERMVLRLLGENDDDPALELFDREGKRRAILGLGEDGAPFLKKIKTK